MRRAARRFGGLLALLVTAAAIAQDGSDERAATQRAAFDAMHRAIAAVYPAFELKEIDWEVVGDELRPRAEAAPDDNAFGLVCLELVARLEDNHAVLLEGSRPRPTVDRPTFGPGLWCLVGADAQPVVYEIDRGSPAARAGIEIGMTVVTVDGRPVVEAIDAAMNRLRVHRGFSSERTLRYDAVRAMLLRDHADDPIEMTLATPEGEAVTVELEVVPVLWGPGRLPAPIAGIDDRRNVTWTVLPSDVGYIRVRRIRDDLADQLDAAVGAMPGARGIIIDLRGNSGGGFDRNRVFLNFDGHRLDVEPERPRYLGPMAILIDGRAISAAEGWASWFRATNRATFYGTTTAGASARKEILTPEPGWYQVRVPVKLYRGFLDRPIERRGIEPDVEIRPAAADLARGVDTVLERARVAVWREAITAR